MKNKYCANCGNLNHSDILIKVYNIKTGDEEYQCPDCVSHRLTLSTIKLWEMIQSKE